MKKLEGESIIPAYIFEKDDKPEVMDTIADNISYILTAGGWFLRKSNELYNSVTTIKSADFLGQLSEGGTFKTVKLPREILMQCNGFMKAVYDKHKSESVVLLYHNFSQKNWIFCVPEQTVSGGAAHYKLNEKTQYVFGKGVMNALPEGYTMIGSIHSHASMSAFASGTDNNDECNFDGFHITVGNMDREFTYHARLIMSGMKKDVNLSQVVEGMADTATFPECLLDNVSEPQRAITVSGDPHGLQRWSGHDEQAYQKYSGRSSLYDPFYDAQDPYPQAGARDGGGDKNIPTAKFLGIKIHGCDETFNPEVLQCKA